jgi:hypothetical protein
MLIVSKMQEFRRNHVGAVRCMQPNFNGLIIKSKTELLFFKRPGPLDQPPVGGYARR